MFKTLFDHAHQTQEFDLQTDTYEDLRQESESMTQGMQLQLEEIELGLKDAKNDSSKLLQHKDDIFNMLTKRIIVLGKLAPKTKFLPFIYSIIKDDCFSIFSHLINNQEFLNVFRKTKDVNLTLMFILDNLESERFTKALFQKLFLDEDRSLLNTLTPGDIVYYAQICIHFGDIKNLNLIANSKAIERLFKNKELIQLSFDFIFSECLSGKYIGFNFKNLNRLLDIDVLKLAYKSFNCNTLIKDALTYKNMDYLRNILSLPRLFECEQNLEVCNKYLYNFISNDKISFAKVFLISPILRQYIATNKNSCFLKFCSLGNLKAVQFLTNEKLINLYSTDDFYKGLVKAEHKNSNEIIVYLFKIDNDKINSAKEKYINKLLEQAFLANNLFKLIGFYKHSSNITNRLIKKLDIDNADGLTNLKYSLKKKYSHSSLYMLNLYFGKHAELKNKVSLLEPSNTKIESNDTLLSFVEFLSSRVDNIKLEIPLFNKIKTLLDDYAKEKNIAKDLAITNQLSILIATFKSNFDRSKILILDDQSAAVFKNLQTKSTHPKYIKELNHAYSLTIKQFVTLKNLVQQAENDGHFLAKPNYLPTLANINPIEKSNEAIKQSIKQYHEALNNMELIEAPRTRIRPR